ncbi:putative 37S ribosomal protein S18, mitochondrial [Lachnellula cervina]|uniref:Small ribosomal subunit protein uS11m n=1 Tax=Lachnellula cervina TaxID=1316786 RepID=A0A7D8UTY7_9HELO|nr:putative 37S ribosomal protein S18, mitochondrial [Lachnellula cervina]
MSRTAPRRLLAQSPLGLFPELAPASRASARRLRPFSHTCRRKADEDNTTTPPPTQSSEPQKPATRYATPADDFVRPSASLNPKAQTKKGMGSLAALWSGQLKNLNSRQPVTSLYNTGIASDGTLNQGQVLQEYAEPHHFHIYATRHNTHITLTSPARAPLISVSAGNIGFKNSARKHYDSAFQLASYVMTRMQDRGINAQIKQLEVVLRGFGAGREAVTKALLGLEGKHLRHKIVKVADATRLKFGGTRSKKPRRLG